MPFDARAARGVETSDARVVDMGVGALLRRVLGRPTGTTPAGEDGTPATAAAAAARGGDEADAKRRRKRAEDEDCDARDDRSDAFASVEDDSNDSMRSGEEEMEEDAAEATGAATARDAPRARVEPGRARGDDAETRFGRHRSLRSSMSFEEMKMVGSTATATATANATATATDDGDGKRRRRQSTKAREANEENSNEELDKAAVRKMRPEDWVDLEMAAELSLDLESLTDVERRFAPPGETHRDGDFIAVRNALVAKWRQRPCEYLTAKSATVVFKKKFHNLAVQAHAYLTTFGYINFGTMTRTTNGTSESAFDEFKSRTRDDRKLSVVVIGAGAAGLAAAKHLQNLGHAVVVVESRDCPGGRVRTEEFATTSTSTTRTAMNGAAETDGQGATTAKIDLGASILSGSNGNPLCVLAKQLKLKSHVVRSVCPLFRPDGLPVDDGLDKAVEKKFNEILEAIAVYRAALPPSVANGKSLGDELEKRINRELEKTPSEKRGPTKDLFNWHIANLEFANAAKIRDLSLLQWDQDDEFDFTGNHVVVSGGNGQFIDSLAKNLTVWYDHAVTGVTDAGALGTRGVVVHCGDKVDIMADCCVVTVPLGVLKKEIIDFVPALPYRKLQAIENINFGTLNKVALVFPTKFWDEDSDALGFVQHQTADRGRYFLIYSYSRDDNSLLALCAGDAAIEVEKLDEADVIEDLVRHLRSAYEKHGVKVPDPVSGRVTAWHRDEHAYGSYSSCSTTTTRQDYVELAKPAGNVYFAGEATTCQYPATLHGAFLSGMREAGRIAVRDRFDENAFDKLGEVTVTINDASDDR